MHLDLQKLGRLGTVTGALTQSRRIRYFNIVLATSTVELPWSSRSKLLDHVGKHSGGLQVRLAFEAVGTTRPVMLDAPGRHLLLEVVEEWLAERDDHAVMPEGIRELRDALRIEFSDGE